METIKISVEVNVNLSDSTQAFIKSLFGGIATNPKATSIEGIAVVEETRAMDKAEKVPAPAAKKEEAKPVPAAKKEEAPAVSIDDVRKALAEKVNEHRSTIKEKLTELGAPSVTKLDPAKYEEMYNFLTAL